MLKRWATKKTAGSTKNERDSKPKNLELKIFGGERVIPGNIIVRQRLCWNWEGSYPICLERRVCYFERHKLSGRKRVHVVPEDGHVLHPVHATTASPDLKAAS